MHELRPVGEKEAQLWDVAATVPDPEIPVISIADLGILRGARFDAEQPVITITPTYSGCPAMETISTDVKNAVEQAGFPRPTIDLVLHPAWTTDWITEEGKQALEDYGIAPPRRESKTTGPIPLTLSAPVTCPRCKSRNTHKLSHFGSTSCKALYSCRDCHEPFDYFKVH